MPSDKPRQAKRARGRDLDSGDISSHDIKQLQRTVQTQKGAELKQIYHQHSPVFKSFFFFAGQSGPGPECRLMSDIQTYLTVETIIDLGGDFNWLQGLSSSK